MRTRLTARSLRRRFEQNQEDCTFTVLAILPTATENILDAIPVEQVLEELQRQKAERLSRSVGPSEIASSAPPSVAETTETTEDDAQSSSQQTDGFIHASQVVTDGNSTASPVPVVLESSEEKKSKKSKAQLWNEMKISCMSLVPFADEANTASDNTSIYSDIHARPAYPAHTNSTQPTRPPQLSRIRSLASCTPAGQRSHPNQPREQRR